ncbi:MAG: pyridoxamine 5'-phosphate oxidase family protein [Bacteroidales bacterium]
MGNTLFTDVANAQTIIEKCDVCYLAMVDQENKPYVLPFNFGFEEGTVYLHSGPVGKKIDILKNNPNVCVSFSTDHQLFNRHEQVACSYGMRYKSVLVKGEVVFIEDYEEKVRALNIIMRKYAGREFTYNAPAVNNVAVYKVVAGSFETKYSGY